MLVENLYDSKIYKHDILTLIACKFKVKNVHFFGLSKTNVNIINTVKTDNLAFYNSTKLDVGIFWIKWSDNIPECKVQEYGLFRFFFQYIRYDSYQ